MSALLKYHGAKWKVAKWICALMPSHRCFVEGMGGSGAVMQHKAPATTEVYNDTNAELINLFRQVRENGERLAYVVENTLYSRAELELAYQPCEDPLEAARRFLVRSQQSISTTSLNEITGFRAHINKKDYASQPSTWMKAPEAIYAVRRRFANVIVENVDVFKLLERYDLPDTLWYFDPPYPKITRTRASNRRGYAHDFTPAQHVELLNRSKGLAGKVMISSYKNPLYDEHLEGWWVEQCKGFSDSRTQEPRTETIYMNFPPPKLLF